MRYWTITKFANWLRGTKMPSSGTMDDWEEWEDQARAAHPFRYWLADTVLARLERFAKWPLNKFNDVIIYITNRWITQSNALVAHKDDIKPGEFCELSDMIIPCLFNGLVDYVEVSLAWMTVCCSKDAAKNHNIPWTMTTFPFRLFKPLRSASAGLENLKWASELIVDESYGVEPGSPSYGKPTAQAESAKEVLVLYHWWKERKKRPDPIESTGWIDFCQRRRVERTPEMQEEAKILVKRVQDLETQYEQEDTEMLIRLIKIRDHLWT